MKTLAQHWGDKVKERRESLGFTQAQLAEMCGKTQQAIAAIENGKAIPHDKLKIVLANRLGIAPAKLFVWPDRDALVEAAS